MHPIRQRLRRLTHVQWVVLLAAFAFVAMLLIWRATRPPEPSYQGKPASAWLRQYSASAHSYYDRQRDWGDREEAVLAFRAMGSNGLAFLIPLALQEDKPGWRQKLARATPPEWSRYNPFSKDLWDRHTPAADLLNYELKPPAGQLLPLLDKACRSTNIWERKTAVKLVGCVDTNSLRLVVPLILRFAMDTNAEVRFWGVAKAGELASAFPAETMPVLTNALTDSDSRLHFALNAAIDSGPMPPSTIPVLESLRSSPDEFVWPRATGALFKIDPSRRDLLTNLIAAAVGTNEYAPTAALSTLRGLDKDAEDAIPWLKGLALTAMRTNSHRMLVIWAMESISLPEAIVTLEHRLDNLDESGECDIWLWDIGELLRIAPTDSTSWVNTFARLEEWYDARTASKLHDGWKEWRTTMLAALEPDSYDKPPPDDLLKFLQRIEKDDPDKEPRHAAAQALKYFHLRWPK